MFSSPDQFPLLPHIVLLSRKVVFRNTASIFANHMAFLAFTVHNVGFTCFLIHLSDFWVQNFLILSLSEFALRTFFDGVMLCLHFLLSFISVPHFTVAYVVKPLLSRCSCLEFNCHFYLFPIVLYIGLFVHVF